MEITISDSRRPGEGRIQTELSAGLSHRVTGDNVRLIATHRQLSVGYHIFIQVLLCGGMILAYILVLEAIE